MSLELAKRALACKGWRWMQGVVIGEGCVVILPQPPEQARVTYRGELPDLAAPATRGCLLEMVREAYKNPTMHVWRCGLQWVVCDEDAEHWHAADTEKEALVIALEAAGEGAP